MGIYKQPSSFVIGLLLVSTVSHADVGKPAAIENKTCHDIPHGYYLRVLSPDLVAIMVEDVDTNFTHKTVYTGGGKWAYIEPAMLTVDVGITWYGSTILLDDCKTLRMRHYHKLYLAKSNENVDYQILHVDPGRCRNNC